MIAEKQNFTECSSLKGPEPPALTSAEVSLVALLVLKEPLHQCGTHTLEQSTIPNPRPSGVTQSGHAASR